MEYFGYYLNKKETAPDYESVQCNPRLGIIKHGLRYITTVKCKNFHKYYKILKNQHIKISKAASLYKKKY